MTDVPQLLEAANHGDRQAAAELLPLVYAELRKLAAARMAHEKLGQTLDATALVHEAYLRLLGDDQDQSWDHRGHFFAAAAEAMRRILIENARRKRGTRKGGEWKRVDADLGLIGESNPTDRILDLDEALSRLAEESPVRARLVELRFFAGLTMPEAAKVLGISVATAERYWTYSRTWLFARLNKE